MRSVKVSSIKYSTGVETFSGRLREYLGVKTNEKLKILDQDCVFDWSECVRGEYFVFSGQESPLASGDLPRFPIPNSSPHCSWKIHADLAFSSRCVLCYSAREAGIVDGSPECKPRVVGPGLN